MTRYKRKIEVHIDVPITEEDLAGLENAIRAALGILITPESYTVESFTVP